MERRLCQPNLSQAANRAPGVSKQLLHKYWLSTKTILISEPKPERPSS
jgi:hypothetical protein